MYEDDHSPMSSAEFKCLHGAALMHMRLLCPYPVRFTPWHSLLTSSLKGTPVCNYR